MQDRKHDGLYHQPAPVIPLRREFPPLWPLPRLGPRRHFTLSIMLRNQVVLLINEHILHQTSYSGECAPPPGKTPALRTIVDDIIAPIRLMSFGPMGLFSQYAVQAPRLLRRFSARIPIKALIRIRGNLTAYHSGVYNLKRYSLPLYNSSVPTSVARLGFPPRDNSPPANVALPTKGPMNWHMTRRGGAVSSKSNEMATGPDADSMVFTGPSNSHCRKCPLPQPLFRNGRPCSSMPTVNDGLFLLRVESAFASVQLFGRIVVSRAEELYCQSPHLIHARGRFRQDPHFTPVEPPQSFLAILYR